MPPFPTQLGDAVIAAKSFEHDADLSSARSVLAAPAPSRLRIINVQGGSSAKLPQRDQR